jgi:hypothetical protein
MIADHATSLSKSAVQSSQQRESRHGASALRRHWGAGQSRVEKRHQKRDNGRDFLGVDAQRQRRHQRYAIAQQPHHQANHEHDVQARDRQDVRQTRIAHGVIDVLVHGGLLAGQQRRRHAAFGSGQRLEDTRRDVGAQAVDESHDAIGPAVVDHRRRCQRVPHGAQLLIPGDPLEIESTRRGRP